VLNTGEEEPAHDPPHGERDVHDRRREDQASLQGEIGAERTGRTSGSNCSYPDMIKEGAIVHRFVPHSWERVLYRQSLLIARKGRP